MSLPPAAQVLELAVRALLGLDCAARMALADLLEEEGYPEAARVREAPYVVTLHRGRSLKAAELRGCFTTREGACAAAVRQALLEVTRGWPPLGDEVTGLAAAGRWEEALARYNLTAGEPGRFHLCLWTVEPPGGGGA